MIINMDDVFYALNHKVDPTSLITQIEKYKNTEELFQCSDFYWIMGEIATYIIKSRLVDTELTYKYYHSSSFFDLCYLYNIYYWPEMEEKIRNSSWCRYLYYWWTEECI